MNTFEMNAPEKKPWIAAYSTLLPIMWLALGALIDYFIPVHRSGSAGILGLVLLIIASMSLIGWHVAHKFRRQFTPSEKWRLIIYTWAWAVIVEMLALWSVSTTGSYETISWPGMMAIVAVTVVIDFLLIWAGVQKFAMGAIERRISKLEGMNEAGV